MTPSLSSVQALIAIGFASIYVLVFVIPTGKSARAGLQTTTA